MSKRALLNKVTALIQKKAGSQSLGLSFVIQLDDEEPTYIRTRGFNEQHNKYKNSQEVQEND